jgi:hypothetical protein
MTSKFQQRSVFATRYAILWFFGMHQVGHIENGCVKNRFTHLCSAMMALILAWPCAVQAQSRSTDALSIESAASELSLDRPITVLVEHVTTSEERAVAFRDQAAMLFPNQTVTKNDGADSRAAQWGISASKTSVLTLEQIKALVLPMQGIGRRNSGSLNWSLSQTRP